VFVIPALKRLRQDDHKFQAILGYIVRAYLSPSKKMVYIHNGNLFSHKEE
jgi:hypothetical protein